jgi:putative flippase GtrA
VRVLEGRERVRQPLAFVAVGLASALVDGGTFLLLVHLGVAPGVASVLGFSAAFVVNYRGNRDLVFRAERTRSGLVRYVALVLANLAVSGLGVWALVSTGLVPWAAKLTTMVVVATVNFLVLRRWVFRPAPAR